MIRSSHLKNRWKEIHMGDISRGSPGISKRDLTGKEREVKSHSEPSCPTWPRESSTKVGKRSWLGRWEHESQENNGFCFGCIEFELLARYP